MPRTPQPPSGEMSADQIRSGIAKIQRRIAELDAFDPTSIIDRKTPELTELAAKIATTIADVFSPGSVDFGRFNSAAWFDTDGRKRSSAYGSRRLNRGELQHSIAEQKDENLALLRAALTILEERLPHHEPAIAEPIEATDLCTSRRIFVVHGHDEGSKEAVARFLETLEFQPIILNEKADEGRTIIEKFEHHADVGFAVVLLTLGRSMWEETTGQAERHPRARILRSKARPLTRVCPKERRCRAAVGYSGRVVYDL